METIVITKADINSTIPVGAIGVSTAFRVAPIFNSTSLSLEIIGSSTNSGNINAPNFRNQNWRNYSSDPVIRALSRAEIISEINAMFGKWNNREDIGDDWLENIRRGWDNRLDDIFNSNRN